MQRRAGASVLHRPALSVLAFALYLRGGHRPAQLSSAPAEGSLGTRGKNTHFPGRRKQQLDNLEDYETQDVGALNSNYDARHEF